MKVGMGKALFIALISLITFTKWENLIIRAV